MRFFVRLSVVSLGMSLFAVPALAMTPSLNLQSQIGIQNPWSADFWWPWFKQEQHYFAFDSAAAYSFQTNNSSLQLGLIYRHLQTRDQAWGTYLYGAYNRSPQSQEFETLNPGVEWLNDLWHVNLNAYLPISPTRQATGSANYANQFGSTSFIQFQGHQEYDQILQASNSTGAGADLIGHYKLKQFHNIGLSAGGYYFHIPHPPIGVNQDVLGISTGIHSPPIHHISAELNYSYDQLNQNTVVVALNVHFGETTTTELALLDQPVQHNIATLGQANTIPISNGLVPIGGLSLYQDNIWFFEPSDTAPMTEDININSCTYEHPCTDLSNARLESIANVANAAGLNNPNIYLKSGTYTSVDNGLVLYGNESLIGRSSDYKTVATGDARPTIIADGIDISSDNQNSNNTLSYLQLKNKGAVDLPAIFIGDPTQTLNVTLDNLKIGLNDVSGSSENYNIGVEINGGNQININNSTINANNSYGGSSAALGITVADANMLNINNSTMNVATTGDNNNSSYGILFTGNDTTMNLAQSTLNISNSGADSSLGATIIGAESAILTNTININQSTLNANASGNNNSVLGINLGGDSVINLDGVTFQVNVSSTGSNQGATNIELNNAAAITINNSMLTGYATSTTGRAASSNVQLENQSSATINNSNLSTDAASALVTGNTNITTSDSATATVNNSTLSTTMAGGPVSGFAEPSGAVSLWGLDNSNITVNNSTISATANNADTLAAIIELQDQATATMTGSVATTTQPGNATPMNPSVLAILADESTMNISDSTLTAYVSGEIQHNAVNINAFGNSIMNISNSHIAINNTATAIPSTLETIGVVANDNALVELNGVDISVNGHNPFATQTNDNGRIIVNP